VRSFIDYKKQLSDIHNSDTEQGEKSPSVFISKEDQEDGYIEYKKQLSQVLISKEDQKDSFNTKK
jgi:hypothetical protein